MSPKLENRPITRGRESYGYGLKKLNEVLLFNETILVNIVVFIHS